MHPEPPAVSHLSQVLLPLPRHSYNATLTALCETVIEVAVRPLAHQFLGRRVYLLGTWTGAWPIVHHWLPAAALPALLDMACPESQAQDNKRFGRSCALPIEPVKQGSPDELWQKR